jgi:pyruvate dehydrogenase E2 component (dihydrolipoamide acetyltransferase)
MASKVKVPKLTENADEVTLTSWLKREGESVAKGEPLVEMTTDKAAFEFESPVAGLLLKIISPEKSVLPTGYVVAIIGAAGEALPDVSASNARLLEGRKVKIKPNPASPPPVVSSVPSVSALPTDPGLVRATPAARRLAREKGIDLARVKAENQAEVVTEDMVKRFKTA